MKTIKDYFKIYELVDETVYNKYGEAAWSFLDPLALECLLIVREGLDKPISVNNWKSGGQFSQRGLRHNASPMVKKKSSAYLSMHMFGKAFDFDVSGMTSTEVRAWIVENEYMFPCKVRLERNLNGKPISWVHMDIRQQDKNPKVYEFDV